jgi:predicted O-methyltransferase YrrM
VSPSPLAQSILRYLSGWGFIVTEGSTNQDELAYLAGLVTRIGARRIGEIGFNAGMSSLAFLEASRTAEVVSFDLDHHPYVRAAKGLVDRLHPGRHTLVTGDSRETVPRFAESWGGGSFDLVFVDGGHALDVVRADLRNMRVLSRAGTIVVIDDLTPWRRWGEGPARAWQEAVVAGTVVQEELYSDGRPVERIKPPADRVWAMGRYTA